MSRNITYNTKQHEAILNYIISLEGAHVTAAQIEEHFGKEGIAVGRTTIYRHLDKLTESGKLRRYTTDGISGACFQLADDGANCQSHFHLKCEDCGVLLHLTCDMLEEIQAHILDKHAFQMNALKTVLYGTCGDCLLSAQEEDW